MEDQSITSWKGYEPVHDCFLKCVSLELCFLIQSPGFHPVKPRADKQLYWNVADSWSCNMFSSVFIIRLIPALSAVCLSHMVDVSCISHSQLRDALSGMKWSLCMFWINTDFPGVWGKWFHTVNVHIDVYFCYWLYSAFTSYASTQIMNNIRIAW